MASVRLAQEATGEEDGATLGGGVEAGGVVAGARVGARLTVTVGEGVADALATSDPLGPALDEVWELRVGELMQAATLLATTSRARQRMDRGRTRIGRSPASHV